jgi:hypothetical protein
MTTSTTVTVARHRHTHDTCQRATSTRDCPENHEYALFDLSTGALIADWK